VKISKIQRDDRDSYLEMKSAFEDLKDDTFERPRMTKSIRRVRKLLLRHCRTVDLYDFNEAMKQIDAGLRADKLDKVVIPATKRLYKVLDRLQKAIFPE
jgi:hypothetical protein